jgi:hypothetical protein
MLVVLVIASLSLKKKNQTMAIPHIALIEVPARVRDNPESTSIVLDKLGGANLCSISLDRKLPLEYRLSR